MHFGRLINNSHAKSIYCWQMWWAITRFMTWLTTKINWIMCKSRQLHKIIRGLFDVLWWSRADRVQCACRNGGFLIDCTSFLLSCLQWNKQPNDEQKRFIFLLLFAFITLRCESFSCVSIHSIWVLYAARYFQIRFIAKTCLDLIWILCFLLMIDNHAHYSMRREQRIRLHMRLLQQRPYSMWVTSCGCAIADVHNGIANALCKVT